MPVEASYKALGRAKVVSSREINECYKSNRSPHRRIRLLDRDDQLVEKDGVHTESASAELHRGRETTTARELRSRSTGGGVDRARDELNIRGGR
jgi:hypothetical protein